MTRRTDTMTPPELLEWLLACDARDEIHDAIRAWLQANPRSEEQALAQCWARYYGYDATVVAPVLDELAEVARRIVAESAPGEIDDFDAGRWIHEWAHQPLGALGGQRAVHLLHTEEGVARVKLLLQQIQAGMYV